MWGTRDENSQFFSKVVWPKRTQVPLQSLITRNALSVYREVPFGENTSASSQRSLRWHDLEQPSSQHWHF